MNTLSWIATLLSLVENYAQLRGSGATSAQANLATGQAVIDILSHVNSHPAVVQAAAPVPAPVASVPVAVAQGQAPAAVPTSQMTSA